MARNPTPAPENKETPVNEVVIAKEFQATNKLAAMTFEANAQALAVAKQVGYQGAFTVGALEDEIRFYQQRTVEAVLETGDERGRTARRRAGNIIDTRRHRGS